MMLALSRQEQSEEPLTDLLDLWSHSESYSSCRGERLFARRGGSPLTGAKQKAERSQSADAGQSRLRRGQSPSVASQAAPGQFRLRRARTSRPVPIGGEASAASLLTQASQIRQGCPLAVHGMTRRLDLGAGSTGWRNRDREYNSKQKHLQAR
ncbi:hypothetical protein LH53_05090 [Mesotoga sp. TolDC]|nr:hypothetical protein LH53_05090 [Mesotoga sp. TolDC]